MKKHLSLIIISGLLCLASSTVAFSQVVVNSDGTHSIVTGNVIVNPNGTHSVITGNVIVNPNGTHSVIHNNVIVGSDGSHSVIHGNVLVDSDGKHKTIPAKVMQQKRHSPGEENSAAQTPFSVERWMMGLFSFGSRNPIEKAIK
ncbi:MAG: hypothetical protein EOO20_17255 [Chryseobacterium sp.]|nr:MAG: hypothetical protein EOO20_17255 [Chryseobacterium sp.]